MAAKPKLVANILPALTARTQLGQILKRVPHNNKRYVIDRLGEPHYERRRLPSTVCAMASGYEKDVADR